MYVGLKQPRGDGERYVTPARAAAKETSFDTDLIAFIVKRVVVAFIVQIKLFLC